LDESQFHDKPLAAILAKTLEDISINNTSTTAQQPFRGKAPDQYPAWYDELNGSVMIFVNTAAKANNLAQQLRKTYQIPLIEMHSNIKSRKEKEQNLEQFRSGESKIMICTDSCARGLDLSNVRYVIQAEFALNVVNHLHRIGRASRGGKYGIAINFYNANVKRLVDSIIGDASEGKGYDMYIPDEKMVAEGEEGTAVMKKEGSSIEKSFSRKRGFRNKLKKQSSSKQEDSYSPRPLTQSGENSR
jgi:superfamily II DNA/RNA helicase